MNIIVERTWHEINQRVVYLVKEFLVSYVENSQIDSDNIIVMKIVGILVRKIVSTGMNTFVASWNNHRIRVPCKGIPEQLSTNSRIEPLNEADVPKIYQLVEEYNFNGGSINADQSDVEMFVNISANNEFKKYIDSISFDLIYKEVISNNREIMLLLLNESIDVFQKIDNHFNN